MSVRIRYSKPVEGILTSTQFYTNEAGTRFQVKINTTEAEKKTFSWTVHEDPTSIVRGEGVAVNLHQAKIKAKKKLEELGISFEKESREERDPLDVEASRALDSQNNVR